MTDLEIQIVDVPAERFRRAWGTVATARSDDDSRPLLNCVAIDVFRDGLLLVATDTYILLWEWVPFTGEPLSQPDDLLHRGPVDTILVHDISDLIPALLPRRTQIRSDWEETWEEDMPLQGSVRLTATSTTVDVFYEDESAGVTVARFEGQYPNWRKIVSEAPEPVTTLNLTASTIPTLAAALKAQTTEGNPWPNLTFAMPADPLTPIRLTADLNGLVMGRKPKEA